MIDFATARRNMVDCQIRPNKVTDERILAAMAEVPRERFVPDDLAAIAYVDEDIDVGSGRFLMEPLALARMLQCLEIKDTEVALVIGCATGYPAAILARLAATVVALESDHALATGATSTLEDLAYDNTVVVEADLRSGLGQQAPYDVILFGGAVASIPDQISDELAEGGRLCAVVDDESGMGKAVMVVRSGGVLSRRVLFDAAMPMLPGFTREASFVF